MPSPPEQICGYQFPPSYEVSSDGNETSKAVNYSSCWRPVWEDHEYCIWHTRTDRSKPTELLKKVREDPENRKLNSRNGPAEILDGAYLPGASIDRLSELDGCYLRRANMRDVHYSDGSCKNAEFANADLSEGWFRGTDFEGASFSQASLIDTSLQSANLEMSKLEDAHLSRTNLLDATLSDVKLYGATLNDVKINEGTEIHSQSQPRTWFFGLRAVRPLSIYDPKLELGADQKDSESSVSQSSLKAIYTYNHLADSAAENSLSKLHQQLNVRSRDTYRRYLRNRHKYLRAFSMRFYRSISLYGESLLRVTFIGLLLIVGCALLYMVPAMGGIKASATDTIYPVHGVWNLSNFATSTYFSTVTFSTVGFGNLHPVGSGAHAIAAVESIFGALITAIFVFVLGRRSRS